MVGAQTPLPPRKHDAALLRELNGSLHELSQPITVLLCTLEFGADLDSVDEIKQLLRVALEQSRRLRQTTIAMRTRMGIAMEEAGVD